jgi:hypothetical protein
MAKPSKSEKTQLAIERERAKIRTEKTIYVNGEISSITSLIQTYDYFSLTQI